MSWKVSWFSVRNLCLIQSINKSDIHSNFNNILSLSFGHCSDICNKLFPVFISSEISLIKPFLVSFTSKSIISAAINGFPLENNKALSILSLCFVWFSNHFLICSFLGICIFTWIHLLLIVDGRVWYLWLTNKKIELLGGSSRFFKKESKASLVNFSRGWIRNTLFEPKKDDSYNGSCISLTWLIEICFFSSFIVIG